jgi:hypothetical protein
VNTSVSEKNAASIFRDEHVQHSESEVVKRTNPLRVNRKVSTEM